MRRRKLYFFVLLLGIIIQLISAKSSNLVSLNGESQNARYVEIRRSPTRTKAVDDTPRFNSLPKAHGLSKNNQRDSTEVRRAPQTPTSGASLPSPFAPLIPGMPSMMLPGFPMMLHHSQNQQLQPLPMMMQPAITPPPQIAPKHEIQTLSATLAPTFSLPTLATLIPIPTFPPLTMPPAFDQLAAGYTKKKKRRKHRRKPSRRTSAEEALRKLGDDTSTENDNKLTRITETNVKYKEAKKSAAPVAKSDKDWIVPYYADDKKNVKLTSHYIINNNTLLNK